MAEAFQRARQRSLPKEKKAKGSVGVLKDWLAGWQNRTGLLARDPLRPKKMECSEAVR